MFWLENLKRVIHEMRNDEGNCFRISIDVEFYLTRAVQEQCIVVFKKLAYATSASSVDSKHVSSANIKEVVELLRKERNKDQAGSNGGNQDDGQEISQSEDIGFRGPEHDFEYMPKLIRKRYLVALTKIMNQKKQHYITIPRVSSPDGKLFHDYMCLHVDEYLIHLLEKSREYCIENRIRTFRLATPIDS